VSDLTQHDMTRILEMAITTKVEFNSLPIDEAWQFLRGLFDASDTFYAIWVAADGTYDGLRIKSSCRRKQAIGALLVEDQQFAEAWKAMQDQP
jgi:hypothetical protein